MSQNHHKCVIDQRLRLPNWKKNINIIKDIKSIEFIYTCKSQVGQKNPSLDKSYIITSKKYYDNFDLKMSYIRH